MVLADRPLKGLGESPGCRFSGKGSGGLSSEANLGHHLWPFSVQGQLGLFISGDVRFVS